MADLLLRGRGVDVGARAPGWLLRLLGAALALAIFALADSLGLWHALGVTSWFARPLVMLLGALLAPTRGGSMLWLAAGALATLTCIVLFTPVVRSMALALVRDDRERSADAIPQAVAVLSGGITGDGRMTGPALDRLLTGLADAKARRIPSLVLSVVTNQRRGVRTTSEADQRALVRMIAPDLDLHFVYDVHSTRDEALAFARLARARGWSRVLLVTSPTHTRRACAVVEAAGLAVQCRPAQARDYALSRLDQAENRRLAFADVMYESAATWLYSARGWLR